MAVIRVLIADAPALQGDIVAGLVAAEPDMVVVGSGDTAPLSHLAELSPDVILLSSEQFASALTADDGAALTDLEQPGVGVLVMAARQGNIVRAEVDRDEQAWPDKLVEAIRSAAPNLTARHRRHGGPSSGVNRRC